MEKVNAFKAGISAFFGILSALWGWVGWLIIGWMALMALDFITGCAGACKRGEWSSLRCREGCWHKAGELVVVIVAAGTDLLLGLIVNEIGVIPLPFNYSTLLLPLVLVWYAISELGSIAENAAEMGAPVPRWLTSILAKTHSATDAAGDTLAGDAEERDAE